MDGVSCEALGLFVIQSLTSTDLGAPNACKQSLSFTVTLVRGLSSLALF